MLGFPDMLSVIESILMNAIAAAIKMAGDKADVTCRGGVIERRVGKRIIEVDRFGHDHWFANRLRVVVTERLQLGSSPHAPFVIGIPIRLVLNGNIVQP